MRALTLLLGIAAISWVSAGCPDDADDDDDAVHGDDDDTTPGSDDDDSSASHDSPQVTDIAAWVDEAIGSIVHVSWGQLAPATAFVEYSFDEGTWLSTPVVPTGEGAHEVLLLGVPFDVDVVFRVVNDFGAGGLATDEDSLRTAPLPEGVTAPVLLASDEAAWDPSLRYLLVCINETAAGHPNRYWTLILDRAGRVVWGVQTPQQRVTLQAQVSPDGADLILDHSSYWAIYDDGDASQVVRSKIDGSITDTYDTPGLHHPFTILDDGTLVWGSYGWPHETLVELRPDGTLHDIWACADFHDEVGAVNYCAANTVFWNEADDTFLVSFYSTETVVEIDHATGTTLRYFGHLDGAYTFDPPESAFWWQHGTHYTDTGTLLLSTFAGEHDRELVVREYDLNEPAQALELIWQFGEGEGVEGSEMGEALRLPGGNTLHNQGTASRIREITPDETVAWDVEWAEHREMGRTTPLGDLYALAP